MSDVNSENIALAGERIAGARHLVVGSSSTVYPAAGFANAARRAGAFTIEVNLDPTGASSSVDLALQGQSGEILPLLVRGHDD